MPCDVQTLLNAASANGYQSLDNWMLKMCLLYMLCSGGAGGNSPAYSQGTGAPTTPPTNTANPAVYRDTVTGNIYWWDVPSQTWQ